MEEREQEEVRIALDCIMKNAERRRELEGGGGGEEEVEIQVVSIQIPECPTQLLEEDRTQPK